MKISESEMKNLGHKGHLGLIARNLFPESLIQRSKHGFAPPFFKLIKYLNEPLWDDSLIEIFGDDLAQLWKAASSNQNYGIAAWSLLVCNHFLTTGKGIWKLHV